MKFKRILIFVLMAIILIYSPNLTAFANSEIVNDTNDWTFIESGYDKDGFYYEVFSKNTSIAPMGVLHYVDIQINVYFGQHPYNSFTPPKNYDYYNTKGGNGMVYGVSYVGTLRRGDYSYVRVSLDSNLFDINATYEGTVCGFLP